MYISWFINLFGLWLMYTGPQMHLAEHLPSLPRLQRLHCNVDYPVADIARKEALMRADAERLALASPTLSSIKLSNLITDMCEETDWKHVFLSVDFAIIRDGNNVTLTEASRDS